MTIFLVDIIRNNLNAACAMWEADEVDRAAFYVEAARHEAQRAIANGVLVPEDSMEDLKSWEEVVPYTGPPR